jgi:hypothetical protein
MISVWIPLYYYATEVAVNLPTDITTLCDLHSPVKRHVKEIIRALSRRL